MTAASATNPVGLLPFASKQSGFYLYEPEQRINRFGRPHRGAF